MSQVSIFDAMRDSPVADDQARTPGHDVIDDMHAVLSRIPWVGHARATSRERITRPAAYLYFRPDKLEDAAARERCFDRAAVTLGEDVRGGFRRDPKGPVLTRTRRDGSEPTISTPGWWVRLNGERSNGIEGRRAMLPVSKADPDLAAWCLHIRPPNSIRADAQPLCVEYGQRIMLGAERMGCARIWLRIYAESIAQLVLASHWLPEYAAAVGLALAGVEPKSEEWAVMLDAALTSGQPWAEAIAQLSQRPRRDTLIRALRWVYDARRVSP